MDRIDLSYFQDFKHLKYVKTYEKYIVCLLSTYNKNIFVKDYIYCNYSSFTVVVHGEMCVSINKKQYYLHEKDILFLGTTDLVHIISMSNDYKSLMLIVDVNFMNTILAYNTLFLDIWFRVKRMPQPYVSLKDTQFLIIYNQIVNIMMNIEIERKHKRFWMLNKLASILLEVSNIPELDEDKYMYNNNRAYSIFKNFHILLGQYYKKEREISFYADKLNITVSYLTKIMKKTSPFTFKEQINRMLLINAYHLLLYTDMTVQQIAYELNFSDASSFIKFFKRNTSLSPIEYKKSQKEKEKK
jgi:AraC family transcriptional activator of pobA